MAKPAAALRLRLLGRIDCHLCHNMVAALDALRSDFEFELEILNVDTDAAMRQKYNDRVPVLEGDSEELCCYFFNAEKVRQYLRDRC